MERSYYFDPTSLDEDNENDENEITLDNWKPTIKKKDIIQSEWRKKQIGNNFNQTPSLDDVKKILAYIKHKVSDSEIMNAFGINAETLIAIKAGRYCPVEGISLSDMDKIYLGFESINKKILKLNRACEYYASILFIDKDDLKQYKKYCKNGKIEEEKKDQKIKANKKNNNNPNTETNIIENDQI